MFFKHTPSVRTSYRTQDPILRIGDGPPVVKKKTEPQEFRMGAQEDGALGVDQGFFFILGPLCVFLENAFCSAIYTRLGKDLIVRKCTEVRSKAGSRRIRRV